MVRRLCISVGSAVTAEPLDLEAIKAREADASAGPWEAKAYRVYSGDRSMGERIIAALWRPWGPVTGEGSIEADAAFVAAARSDVPALAAEVERLRAENATLRDLTFTDPCQRCGEGQVDHRALQLVHCIAAGARERGVDL
jgi:hypothetical protein